MRHNNRAGMSLVEMLVAMAVTLIMMGGVVALFGTVGNSVSASRGAIEISERLRYARNRLQEDLASVTVTMLPPRKPEAGEGYFEYIEGAGNDASSMFDGSGNLLPATNQGFGLLGDLDDVVMFTARSRREQFVGKTAAGMATSPEAEIVWFTSIDPNSQPIVLEDGTTLPLRTLYRRVLLVQPAWTGSTSGVTAPVFQADNDLSVRNVPQNAPTDCALNTLGDLTKRENRFQHFGNFPFEVTAIPALFGNRVGEDVILSNVLSFDVRAWDPAAPVREVNGVAVVPGDAGYGGAITQIGTGAYVDLNYSRGTINSIFGGPPQPRSGITGITPSNATYCTWSWHYEAPITIGTINFPGTGTNGQDDGGVAGVVDDPGEMITSPPYPVPLRGIQVKMRVYEPDTRQVREVTVVQDFLPQ